MQISYPNAIVLMEHLQHMGEGNASLNRQFAVGADTFLATAALYQGEAGMMYYQLYFFIYFANMKCMMTCVELFGLEDGSVEATFEVRHSSDHVHA